MRDGDFQGERIHNTLLTDQEIEARVRGVNPRTMGVPPIPLPTQVPRLALMRMLRITAMAMMRPTQASCR
jgi:hypothetical protein